jgi:hypothetical protein
MFTFFSHAQLKPENKRLNAGIYGKAQFTSSLYLLKPQRKNRLFLIISLALQLYSQK